MTTNKFTYSSSAVASATNLTASSHLGSASGNSTFGIFSVGNASNTTNKYSYAAGTSALGTSLTASVNNSGAAVNGALIGVNA